MFAQKRRLVVLLGILVLSAGGCYAYIHFYLSRPIGSGPAGPAVASGPFTDIWTRRAVHVVGIGDSVTAGLGAKSPAHSYVQRLIQNPSDETTDMLGKSLSVVLPNLTWENLALSGSTSIHHLDLMREKLTPQPASVFGLVLMTTGGNDLIHSYGRSPPREGAMYGASLSQAQPWIEAFALRLEAMLQHLDATFPGGYELYLANIYDPTDGVGDAPSIFLPPWPDGLAIHAQYNQALATASASREYVFLVPLYETFLGHGSHCRQFWRPHYDASDPHYWFFDNVEDPNDRGYDAIRRVFLTTITSRTRLRIEP